MTSGFMDARCIGSSKVCVLTLCMWFCSSVSHAVMNAHLGCQQAGEASLLACLVNTGATAVLCAMFYCSLHICCALQLAIDHYCLHIFDAQGAASSIAQWNVLQAMLRRAAQSIEGAFIAASTGVLCVVVLTFLEVFGLFASDQNSVISLAPREGVCMGLWAGWLLPPTALVFYVVFRAAAITEHCKRVPSLVNSWIIEDGEVDHEKQYAVQYIRHSSAGFYVKGVRLNATWAFKLSYMSGVLLFTLLTQSMLKPAS